MRFGRQYLHYAIKIFGLYQSENQEQKKKKSITTQEFDKLFEEEKDITGFLDIQTAKRNVLETRRVSVDFPEWMIIMLDQQAMKLGVTRQSVIKFWISEKLKSA